MLTPAAATEALRSLTRSLSAAPPSAEELDTATETAIQALRTLRGLLHELSAAHSSTAGVAMEESCQELDRLAQRLDSVWTASASASPGVLG